MIELHLVSWNRPEMTKLVIEAIHRNTKEGTYRLYVWDNDSEKLSIRMLVDMRERGKIDRLELSPANIGLEGARDLLSITCETEYFVCVDNDCLPQERDEDGKDWLERLVELMELYPGTAAISCRTQAMIGTGNIFEDADKLGRELVDFPHPGGSLRIMRTDAVKTVGGWDRRAEGRGSEERYICGKLRDVGYTTGFATFVKTLHLFGLRGENGTDFWGYNKKMKPEDSGHSDIWHPALANGDQYDDLVAYCGEELANAYCHNKAV